MYFSFCTVLCEMFKINCFITQYNEINSSRLRECRLSKKLVLVFVTTDVLMGKRRDRVIYIIYVYTGLQMCIKIGIDGRLPSDI